MAEFWDVYTVTPPRKEGGRENWTRIGVAFVNRDGSFKVRLDATPVNGELVIRRHEERDQGQARRMAQQAQEVGLPPEPAQPSFENQRPEDFDPFA